MSKKCAQEIKLNSGKIIGYSTFKNQTWYRMHKLLKINNLKAI